MNHIEDIGSNRDHARFDRGRVRAQCFTLRATREVSELLVDAYVFGPGGKTAYRVVDVVKVRCAATVGAVNAGTPKRPDRVRLIVLKTPIGEIAGGVPIAAWPVVRKTVSTLASKPLQAVPMPAPHIVKPVPAGPQFEQVRRKRERRRAEHARNKRHSAGDPHELMAPAVRRATIKGADGQVIRGPTADRAEWRDPDDTNVYAKHAREITGWRAHDALLNLSKHNPNVTDEHKAAASLYQRAWESGPGGARPGYEPTMQPGSKYFGPSSGPDEAVRDGMRSWLSVQRYLRSERAREVLHIVLIDRKDVTAWCKRSNWSVKAGVGYLIATLDQLVEYYRGDIETERSNEEVRRA